MVCIGDKFSNEPTWRAAIHTYPKLHGIYTIRDICNREGLIGLMFEEIWHPPALFCMGWVEPAFHIRNFRPVRKSNIDIFKKMLVPKSRELANV